jgi:hypothetical protein
MAVITPSEHRLYSDMGDYADVEINMVNVIQRYFSSDERYSRFDHIEFHNVNPRLITVNRVPAFFIWCDGSTTSSDEVGGLRSKSLSKREDFYCTAMMIHSGADEYENAQLVKYAGHVVRDALYENMNLNDIMNHTGELFEINFEPEPFDVGGSFKLMQGFAIKIKYSKLTRRKQANR